VIGYSRSTVANVEIGRQDVAREFWQGSDDAVGADRRLLAAYHRVEAAARREQATALRGKRLADSPHPAVITTSSELTPAADLTVALHEAYYPEDVIAGAASQARDHADVAAVTQVGPGTVEQFKVEVVRLGRAYVTRPPFPLFTAMRQVLGRVQGALNQKVYPAQARELTFLAGALCGLMANASLDVGREEAADDLARAAWTYGKVIDHDPLMGWARGTQALAAIWDNRYLDAARYADQGVAHLPTGIGAARLHAIRARALAGHRDFTQARAALQAAAHARSGDRPDVLHNGMAGEFAFGEAKLRYYESLVLVSAGYPAEAERAASAAVSLYQAAPDRARSYGCEALASVQLATARLMTRNLDGAAEAFNTLLELTPDRRISSLVTHLEPSRELLRSPAYRTSRTARQLETQLAAFTTANPPAALPSGH
jgi:tetratricopeptide (TPR) repeat protein